MAAASRYALNWDGIALMAGCVGSAAVSLWILSHLIRWVAQTAIPWVLATSK
jgi:hypothetical protein